MTSSTPPTGARCHRRLHWSDDYYVPGRGELERSLQAVKSAGSRLTLKQNSARSAAQLPRIGYHRAGWTWARRSI